MRDGEFYRNVDRELLAGWLKRAGFAFEIDEAADDIRCVAVKKRGKVPKFDKGGAMPRRSNVMIEVHAGEAVKALRDLKESTD